MNIVERVQSPTPKFFKIIRNIGVVLAAISGTLLAAPIALPVVVAQVATYMGVASVVASAVSQTAIAEDPTARKNAKRNGA